MMRYTVWFYLRGDSDCETVTAASTGQAEAAVRAMYRGTGASCFEASAPRDPASIPFIRADGSRGTAAELAA